MGAADLPATLPVITSCDRRSAKGDQCTGLRTADNQVIFPIPEPCSVVYHRRTLTDRRPIRDMPPPALTAGAVAIAPLLLASKVAVQITTPALGLINVLVDRLCTRQPRPAGDLIRTPLFPQALFNPQPVNGRHSTAVARTDLSALTSQPIRLERAIAWLAPVAAHFPADRCRTALK